MKHNQVLIVMSCILLGLKLAGVWNREWSDYAFFGLVMVVIGLPHGAVDHLIHIRQKQQEELSTVTLWKFVRSYLALIALYGLLWYLLPAVSLLIFIVLSCYHFGQSQLYYFFNRGGVVPSFAYILWGLSVLSYIVCWNSEDSAALVGSLIPEVQSWLAQSQVAAYVRLVPWMLSAIPVVFLLSRLSSQTKTVVFWEVGSLLTIGLVSYYGGLLIAFSVYFGFWHSSKSLRAIVRTFRNSHPGYDFTRFYKDAFLFSMLSLAGIAVLVLSSYYFVFGIHPVMLFFVLISLLTFPHMVILEEVYKA